MKVLDFSARLLSKASDVFLELFYPLHCDGCGIALFAKTHLCDHCWSCAKPLSHSICKICSYQLVEEAHCKNCADRKLHFMAGVSAFQYEGLVKELLHRFKYGGDQSLKKVMGELLAEALQDVRLQDVFFEAVVPIPLHLLREREREFNQAYLLAHEVASQLQRPLRPLLCCERATAHQARSDRQERIKNRRDLFAIKKAQKLSGNYLLVDDVLTTGATLDAAAKALLGAGADNVWAVTVARS